MNAQSLISSNIQLHENDTKVFITNGTQKLLEKRRRGHDAGGEYKTSNEV